MALCAHGGRGLHRKVPGYPTEEEVEKKTDKNKIRIFTRGLAGCAHPA
jgi:hypothetical protein